MNGWLLFMLAFLPAGQRPEPPALLPNPAKTLQTYRQCLSQLRQDYPATDSLPELAFFLFGMGNRMKLIYRNGRLVNARTGNIEWQWDARQEIIVPSEYTVQLDLRAEPGTPLRSVQIREDETGVWILQTGKRPRLVPGTRSPVRLPRFESRPAGPVMRVLLQEVLMNIMEGKPLTSFFVYDQPIAQDTAAIRAVLQATGNTSLVDPQKDTATAGVIPVAAIEKNRLGGVDYPLSWQRNAPGAHYPGLTVLEKTLIKQRLIPAQAGYAARLFLAISGRQ